MLTIFLLISKHLKILEIFLKIPILILFMEILNFVKKKISTKLLELGKALFFLLVCAFTSIGDNVKRLFISCLPEGVITLHKSKGVLELASLGELEMRLSKSCGEQFAVSNRPVVQDMPQTC